MQADIGPTIPELVEHPVQAVKAGLSVEHFDQIREILQVPIGTLLRILDISESTLNRRRRHGHFNKSESEHLARIARIVDHGIETTGSVENARRWLTSPKVALEGETPLEYMETEQGALEVDRLLTRIDYGVY